MDINLAGRAAVVTGGSKGIGLAVVRHLAASGAQVITGANSQPPEIKALSKEVGPHGIRVNTVSPGPVATDLWLGSDGVAATVSPATEAKPGDAAQSVTGRFSQPADVADLVLYLASDHAANTIGADFTIDGGLIPTW